jgi:acetolactate synthase-1/2/3 large subunit
MCYEPRHLLFSNGQQTLGVALPWAISACLARPNTTVLSMSGDGGFLFSAQELETAVRLGCNFTHIVWRDGRYDMVAFQQRMKYGRDSGVDFGEPDIVAYAEAFGATGLRLEQADQLSELVQQGMNTPGPVLIDMPVDYSDNDSLAATMQDIARWH